MITCKKSYIDIPFAHRQHLHGGQCALIHGHNWSITLTFGCHEPDENGFVVDFGKLKYIRSWIDEHLDHACVFGADDPVREQLTSVGGPEVWKVFVVENCSCEGLARHLFDVFNPMVGTASDGRAFLLNVEVGEDSKNSASYSVASDVGDFSRELDSSASEHRPYLT
jgi:6-pyruvoyltetrahydropterin/6-carboxytetrahydropterin synthase